MIHKIYVRYFIMTYFNILIMAIITLAGTAQPLAQSAQEYYEQGLALKEEGKIDSAVVFFEKAVKKEKKFAEANYELANCYLLHDSPTYRMHAENAIKRAIKQEKKNVKYLYLHAEIKKRQNFDYEYRKLLKEVLKIDPLNHEARFKLAQEHIDTGNKGGYEKAEELILELEEYDPDYPDIEYLLGRMYFEIDEFTRAELHLQKQIDETPDHGAAKVYLGMTCYRLNKDPMLTTQLYLDGLDITDDPDLLELIENDMRGVFTEDEKKALDLLPIEEKGAFIADFWRGLDSNVMTPENERIIEHFRRVAYAKEHFDERNYRGFDDRGEIFIKYGEPDERYRDIGQDPLFVRENESWLYHSISEYLAYDFVSYEGIYRHEPDLTRAVKRSASDSYLSRVGSLYVDRIHMGGIYAIAATNSMGDFRQTLAFVYGPERDRAIASSPPQKHVLEFEETPLEFHYSYAQFRGADGDTEVELYTGIPHEQLEFSEGINGYAADVAAKLVVIDSTSNRVIEDSKDLRIRIPQVVPDIFTLDLQSLIIKPGEYTLGIQAHQEQANRLGIYQPEINIRDFSGDDLMISDIRICSEPELEVSTDIVSRSQLTLKPYPFNFVKKSQPLALYYEIYNLQANASGTSTYELTYTIAPAESDAPPLEKVLVNLGRFLIRRKSGSIAVTEERTVGRSSVFEMVVIDINELPEQSMLITVGVKDNLSGTVSESKLEVKIIQ
ncbi:GWxTD domain-containing protein [candidate division KSB1 bacterium]